MNKEDLVKRAGILAAGKTLANAAKKVFNNTVSYAKSGKAGQGMAAVKGVADKGIQEAKRNLSKPLRNLAGATGAAVRNNKRTVAGAAGIGAAGVGTAAAMSKKDD